MKFWLPFLPFQATKFRKYRLDPLPCPNGEPVLPTLFLTANSLTLRKAKPSQSGDLLDVY